MPDNVQLNEGSGGETIASDLIAGIQHQRVKVQYGTDGNATDVSDTNPLPIDDAGGSITIDSTVLDTVETNTDSLTVTGGGTEASALRVTLANDSTGVVSIDDNGGSITVDNSDITTLAGAVAGTEMQCDIVSSAVIPISDNNGSITVDNSVLTNLDATISGSELQVDIVSSAVVPISDNGGSLTIDGTVTANLSAVDNAVLDTIETNTDSLTVTGGGTEASALRVTLANDSTGVLSIDDNGSTLSIDDGAGSITVDGTVTANLSEADNAVLDTIETNTDSLTVTGGGTEASALRVTLANNSTGVLSVDDNGSSLTVDNSVLTSFDAALTDSTVQVDVISALPSGTNNIGDVDVVSTVTPTPQTSGGLSIFRSLDLDESEEQVKATAGQIYSIFATNTNASARYLKVYNATAANTTVGVTTPVMTFLIPPDNSGFSWNNIIGLELDTAITVAVTTGVGDGDTGAPGANECVVQVFYK